MTLEAFMSALNTKGVKVTLLDSDGQEIIKFYSDGYAGVESEILARTVKKFELTANNAITVSLKDIPESSGTSTATLYTP